MSKKNQRPEVPDSLLETAMTIVSPPQDASGAKEASDGADRKHLTEVTISEPAAAKDAPEPSGEEEIEATIPMSQSRHTAHTELMDTPPSGERSVIGDLLPGDRVERYVIVKRLGQGGMGSVYLARHETLGVFRAIKVLSGALYQRGKEFTRRFIQEAKIASSISDPNIVNVLDVGEDPDRSFCYIIMEYVDGGTVRDVLRRIPRLSELHAMVIAEAVAVALNAAAEQKIVHRDIKPDNIMLTRRGEVKLADLGIAKNTDDNVQLTKSHVMMGTPAYLAPEQAQDAHSVDVRADIYSLGATLFEMLTGQIPYPGKSTYDILRKLVSEPVPDPRSIVDTISAPTARLVMRMLAKDAKQRPKSAMELLKEIHKLNSLPANIDTRKCIRELLEQSGEGNYSAASLTSATGNAVSSWFARHVLLRMETALRRVPMFATMLDAMQRNLVLSYILLALIVLLLLGLPAAWYFTRGSRVQVVKDTDFVTVVPEVPQTVDVPEVPAVVPEVPPAPPVVKAPEKPAPAAPAVKAPEVPTAKKPQTPAAGEVSPAKPETPAPEVKRPEPPAPPPKPASRPAVKPPAPKPPAPKPPVAAPRPAEVRKIGFSAEIAPAGAEVILRNEAGRVVERRQAPAGRRMEFSVPAGQYKLEVTAPGYRAESREFPLSESRAISGVKIELQREVASCRVDFYGSLQLLEYLRKRGIEVRVDGATWRLSEDGELSSAGG